MHFVVLIVALVLLALVTGVLRAVPRGGLIGSAAAFLAGLVVVAAGIKTAAHVFALYPDDQLARFAAHAIETDDGRPTIMLWGTSMSRNAIDDDLLTETLNARGYDVRAVSVSIEGASLFERDNHIRQYMRAHRAPEVMLLEIAAPTDETPSYVFDISKFSNRTISQLGPRQSVWFAIGFLRDWRPGIVRWGYHAGVGGLHAGLNWLNVGQLRTLNHIENIESERAFEPLEEQREDIDAEIVAEGLSARDAEPTFDPPQWAVDFREAQRSYLRGLGIEHIHYYIPAVVPADRRAYFEVACERQGDALCLSSEDDALLSRLNDPDLWSDYRHVHPEGARIYTLWLADRLIEEGLVDMALSAANSADEGGEGDADADGSSVAGEVTESAE